MVRRNRWKALSISLLVVLALALAAAVAAVALGPGGTGAPDRAGEADTALGTASPAPQGPAARALPEWDPSAYPDYYAVTGPSSRAYGSITDEEPRYCPLDALGRSSCAEALLTAGSRQEAKDRGRQDVSDLEPSGWGDNFEASIPSNNPSVAEPYTGWFWNRSHLLADSLGGGAVVENLVKGTRPQNVGNRDNAGGMAYAEGLARQWLDDPANASCPLQYSVSAEYEGEDLVPAATVVDMVSCDGRLDQRVVVFNEAAGFSVDRSDGSVTEAR